MTIVELRRRLLKERQREGEITEERAKLMRQNAALMEENNKLNEERSHATTRTTRGGSESRISRSTSWRSRSHRREEVLDHSSVEPTKR